MEALVEVLLPVNYKAGDKVTDLIIINLRRIYGDIVLVNTPTGKYNNLIILNSFMPHSIEVLDVYPPDRVWYFMYDMNWGRQWYEDNRDRMQLITDKPYPGSRFLIPTGMLALSELSRPVTGPRLGKICVMESYKLERIEQYVKYLNSSLEIDIIGTTMNKNYNHDFNKVDSVPYYKLGDLLSNYSICLIFWDKYHSTDALPLKVAECLGNGVIPVLVGEFNANTHILPSVNSMKELEDFITNNKRNFHKIHARIVNFYRGSIDFVKLKRSCQLIETDEMFLRELEELLQWGREKHRGHYWRDNLDVKDFIEALKRHLTAYESGEIEDKESGLSHLISIAANAMFQRRIDEQK